MLKDIEVLCHNCIKINKEKIIYIDPFKMQKEYKDADIIMITHAHYDHFSEEDINKVKKENTKICITKDLKERTLKLGFNEENILIVEPNMKYNIEEIKFETIPAYNISKKFHPKQNKWIGYIIEINGIRYYIAGDTDITEENKNVKCDVAFVPVGGTYTMDSKEAAELINIIKSPIAVPVHYGSIVGTKEDSQNFRKMLNEDIHCEILIK